VFYSNFAIFDFKNAVTLKTGLGVRQGQSDHSIERIYDFLLTFRNNHGPISYKCFRDRRQLISVEYRKLFPPLIFCAPLKGSP